MEDPHPLKSLLQLHLATDSSAVLHLPYVLETLSPEYFLPSAHTQKWVARINSLLNSKDPGARWSGLCIALQTAEYSKGLMLECALSWLGIALPLLSKNDPLPTVKAAIRLLAHIFSSATDVPEFQRQICTPNVPKFTTALMSIVDKHDEPELKLLALNTLTDIVPLYPTLHRASQNSLSALALRFLNGSAPRPTPSSSVEAASALYSALHVTGGKVGAANLWRKSLDETLAFAWTAFAGLRTTFRGPGMTTGVPPAGPSDPAITVPLNLDRLRAATQVLSDLLRASTSRPVVLPIGPLTRFILALLSCTLDEKPEGHIDSGVRSLELSVIPSVWALACELVTSLAKTSQSHLAPHIPQLLVHLVFHLEHTLTARQRLPFLTALSSLIESCGYLHDSVLSSRLARAILPSVTIILQAKSEGPDQAQQGPKRRSKSKKRARDYEGDEVFKVSREIVCPRQEDGAVLLAALDALRLLLQNTQISPAVHSLAARILLAINVAFPQIPPTLLAPHVSLHGTASAKVRNICVELAIGTTSTMSKSLGLVVNALENGGIEQRDAHVRRTIDLLLHPRVPPMVRSLPHVEMLSLFPAEEGEEEKDARHALGLATENDTALPVVSQEPNELLATPSAATREALPPAAALRPTQSLNSEALSATLRPPGTVPSVQVDLPMVQPNTIFSASRSSEQPPPSSRPTTTEFTAPPIAPPKAPVEAPLPPDPTPPVAVAAVSQVVPRVPDHVPMDQDGEDEPMPTIDVDSDSD